MQTLKIIEEVTFKIIRKMQVNSAKIVMIFYVFNKIISIEQLLESFIIYTKEIDKIVI